MSKTILFLCTFNAGRSILAEALLKACHSDAFQAHSAGETPRPMVHPDILALLERHGHATQGLYSKSWQSFLAPDAPTIDLVITLCNNANGEICPVLKGRPRMAHWDIIDPADATSDAERVDLMEQAYAQLSKRIEALIELPDDLTTSSLISSVNQIGWMAA